MKREDTWLDLYTPPSVRLDALEALQRPTFRPKETFRACLQKLGFDEPAIEVDGAGLLELAAQRFRDADAWLDWPDRELWEALGELLVRVSWLRDVLKGSEQPEVSSRSDKNTGTEAARQGFDTRYPSDWGAGPKFVERPPGAGKDRARRRSPARLVTSLDRALSGRGLSKEGAIGFLEAFSGSIEDLERAIEPKRRALSLVEVKSRRAELLSQGLQLGAYSDEELALRLGPFAAGARESPPPLIDLVREAALFWKRHRDKWPPTGTGHAKSKERQGFEDLLKGLTAAHGRPDLSSAVVRHGVERARSTP